MTEITQLFPDVVEQLPLEGLYLGQDLRSIDTGGKPFVYSNFITSLDGRIAVPDEREKLVVPDAVKNDRDWRLFQELAVQADLLFTSGRYLRDYEDGVVQEILQVYDDPSFADLADWREANGLPLQPDLAVISRSADFPIPAPLREDDRRVFVVTTRSADPEQLSAFEGEAEICIAGDEDVDGAEMVWALYEQGYRWMYNATGPKVLHLLIAGGCLDRLYLTQAGRILGGMPYATIVEGDLLRSPADYHLSRMYYDPIALEGVGQVFSVYDRM